MAVYVLVKNNHILKKVSGAGIWLGCANRAINRVDYSLWNVLKKTKHSS